MLKEFREFILRGNLVDLAVAVIIGAAFGAVVTSLVANMFTPLIAAIGGQQDFSTLQFKINGSVFKYGQFINDLLAFLTIAAVVFFFVVRPVNILMSRFRPEVKPAVETHACPSCISDIPLAATRCPFCTSQVDPAGGAGAKDPALA